MSNQISIMTLRQSVEATISWAMQKLLALGFQVERTFDLQVARLAHADCPCPYHGTKDCNCQMIILIVHSEAQFGTVVAHGQDEHTSLALVTGTNQSIDERVIQALLPATENFEIDSQGMPT